MVFDTTYDIQVVAGDDYIGVDRDLFEKDEAGYAGGSGYAGSAELSSDYPTDGSTDDLTPLGDIQTTSTSGFGGTPMATPTPPKDPSKDSAMAIGGTSEVKVQRPAAPPKATWEERLDYDTMSGSESEDDGS